MSVLIKGMKMPKNCWECRFNASTIDRSDVCTITNKTYNWGLPHPPSDCPITELPPHGRLIDADEMVASVKRQTEIMREIAKEVDKLKPIANSKELDDVDIVAIAETVEKGVLQEIANAPTILEAEDGE